MNVQDLLAKLPEGLRALAASGTASFIRKLAETQGKAVDEVAAVLLPVLGQLFPAEAPLLTLDNLHKAEALFAEAEQAFELGRHVVADVEALLSALGVGTATAPEPAAS